MRLFMPAVLAFLLVAFPAAGAAKKYEATVEVQLGLIPLFNVNDGTFTKGDPAPGVSVHGEYRISDRLYLGGEMGFMWIKSVTAETPRFIMSPMVRARLMFPLYKACTLNLAAGAGATIWPEDTHHDMGLSEDLAATRIGFSLRIGVELRYPLTPSTLLSIHGGYFATNTPGQEVSVVMDTVILSVGMTYRF